MKKPQLIGIAIAGVCGLGAFIGMKSLTSRPQVVKQEVRTDTIEVLVAKSDIGLGTITSGANFKWQVWPQDGLQPTFITRRPGGGDPMHEMTGWITKAPMMSGEPITRNKLVKAGEGGVLSAILPPGKRAVSTKIQEDTAVGRLILPNDHVDVLLIRRLRGRGGAEDFVSDTLFRNIRVLAIGQIIEAKEGKRGADGNTATLELTPRQAELLALAKSMGEISLSLRSVADFKGDTVADDGPLAKKEQRPAPVSVMRYGQKARSSRMN